MRLKEIKPGLVVGSYLGTLCGFRLVSRTIITVLGSNDLGSGDLWVCSPGALDNETISAIQKLGRVRWVVAPNSFHHLHLQKWRQTFPQAHYCGVAMLAKKRADFRFDSLLRMGERPPWGDTIKMAVLTGSRFYEEAAFLLTHQQALVVTDLVFHIPPTPSWWVNAIWRGYGVMGKPASSPICKLLVRDRAAAQRFHQQLSSWDFDTLLTGHGPALQQEAKAYTAKALSWMVR